MTNGREAPPWPVACKDFQGMVGSLSVPALWIPQLAPWIQDPGVQGLLVAAIGNSEYERIYPLVQLDIDAGLVRRGGSVAWFAVVNRFAVEPNLDRRGRTQLQACTYRCRGKDLRCSVGNSFALLARLR